MVVKTDTPTVRQLQRIDFQLIMTAHHMDCKNCLSKRHCELQKIAKLLGVRLKVTEYEKLERLNLAVIKHPCFDPVPARCILCRKCLFPKLSDSVLCSRVTFRSDNDFTPT